MEFGGLTDNDQTVRLSVKGQCGNSTFSMQVINWTGGNGYWSQVIRGTQKIGNDLIRLAIVRPGLFIAEISRAEQVDQRFDLFIRIKSIGIKHSQMRTCTAAH